MSRDSDMFQFIQDIDHSSVSGPSLDAEGTRHKASFPCNDLNVTQSINSWQEGRTVNPVATLKIDPDPYLNSTGGLTPQAVKHPTMLGTVLGNRG